MSGGRTTITPKGETYRPQEASTDKELLPAAFTNYPFVFVHYNNGWGWDATVKRMLPELSEIVMRPGVNGIGDDLKPTRALGGSLSKGGVIIQPNDPRLGEWRDYVTRYKTAAAKPGEPTRWHYCFRSVSYEILGNGEAGIIEAPDDYRAFRAYCLDKGIVPPISRPEVSKRLDMERRGLARLVKQARGNAALQPEVDAKRARIKEIEEWWAKQEKGAEPVAEAPRTKLRGQIAPAIDTEGADAAR